MGAVARSRFYTFDDFCFLVKDGQKGDLINGVIYMASPETTDANDLFFWFGTIMRLFARTRKLGTVLGNRVALRLDNRNGPEPDILFVHKSRLYRVKRRHIDGAADLVVEIVTPDSVERDYVLKRNLYEAMGILEYWIVDEMLEKITLLRLAANGKYREVRPRKRELHSKAMPGFWVRPEWFWQRPLPDELQTLQLILARES
jgi:Uma2 family endonuclease